MSEFQEKFTRHTKRQKKNVFEETKRHQNEACQQCWKYQMRIQKQLWLPWWLSGKESACQCKRPGFDPWVRKIPWRRKWQSTPVFLTRKSHGQRNLVGYSPWGSKSLIQLNVEKTLEGPLDCKETQPVHYKGDQSWVFFGRNDA